MPIGSLRPNATRSLLKSSEVVGYPEDELASEIGAELASGNYRYLGLTRDQAKELAYYYFGLLIEVHGRENVEQVAQNLAPLFKEALNEGAHRRRAREQRAEAANRAAKGKGVHE